MKTKIGKSRDYDPDLKKHFSIVKLAYQKNASDVKIMLSSTHHDLGW